MEHYFKPPQPFSPGSSETQNLGQAWKDWKQQFELFLTAAEKKDSPGEVKVAMLLCAMGPAYTKVYNKFTFTNNDQKKQLKIVLEKFDSYFEPKKLVKSYITRFQQRVQEPQETVAEYISALRDLASHCEFGELEDRQVAIQISNGVRDTKLKEKLWEDDLDLDQVTKKCNSFEQSKETRKLCAREAQVHAVSARGQSRGRSRGRGDRGNSRGRGQSPYGAAASSSAPGRGVPYRGRGQAPRGQHYQSQPYHGQAYRGQSRQSNYQSGCSNCGLIHGPRQCPAYNRNCNKCHALGHFAKCCQNKTVHYAEHDSYNDDMYYDTLHYDNFFAEDDAEVTDCNEAMETLTVYATEKCDVKQVNSVKNDVMTVEFQTTRDDVVKFKIDTAADCSVLTKASYDKMINKPKLRLSKVAIRGITGNPSKACGTVTLPVRHRGEVVFLNCEVVNDVNCPNLLSEAESLRLNLVKHINHNKGCSSTSSIPPSAQAVYKQYADVTQGVGKIPGKYALKIDENAQPVAHPPRPIPAALRDATKKKLDEMEKMNIVQKVPVGSPTLWCSALHVVHKKNTSPDVDVRITIDPKDLNKVLLREYHPMKFFTVLDANMGYFQIELTDESQDLTTFNTPFGRYKYLRLPMGVSSAPEIYQRAMGEMFADIDGVEIIMDDILIHAPTLEVHNQRLDRVLRQCREQNLKLNPKKTKLCTNNVVYIGHVLSDEGVKIDDEKVKAVVNMPEPTSIDNVHTLLGMVTYTCKFLPNLSSVTEPLRELIKESNKPGFEFHFDEPQKESFEELKRMMTNAPVLRYYSLDEPITESCDASQSGLGAVLMQGNKPVAYASKSLTKTEYAYAQIEKELLAIVFAYKKFHTYLYGRSDVTVETDHLPLVRIFEKPLHQVPLRLQKMRLSLQHYTFKLIGKSGKDIPVADALSRVFLPDTYKELMDNSPYDVYATEVRSISAFTPKRQTQLVEETKRDQSLQKLAQVVRTSRPEHRAQLEAEVRVYFDAQEEISEVDGILFKGERVIIPESMRKEMLQIVHESHMGMVRCKQLARDIMYWPGMNAQIEDIVSKCHICQTHRNQQPKEPMKPSEVGAFWQQIF